MVVDAPPRLRCASPSPRGGAASSGDPVGAAPPFFTGTSLDVPQRAAPVGLRRAGIGFTLIELMVVMAVIALLLALAAPRYFQNVERSKQAVLREDLTVMREAIDKYYADTGRYPPALDDLVKRRYLRRVPVDPVTDRTDSWILLPPPPGTQGKVYDIQSGAEGIGLDGSAFSKW